MSYLGGICVLFVFENLLAIVFLMLGAVFLDDCPIDPSIPISLLVVGVVSMIHAVVIQFIRWKWIDIKDKKDGFATCAQVVLLITSIIYLVAFIWGNTQLIEIDNCPTNHILLHSVALFTVQRLSLCSTTLRS